MGERVVGVNGSRTDEVVEEEEDTSEAREQTLEVDILDVGIEGSAMIDLRNRDDFDDEEEDDRNGV